MFQLLTYLGSQDPLYPVFWVDEAPFTSYVRVHQGTGFWLVAIWHIFGWLRGKSSPWGNDQIYLLGLKKGESNCLRLGAHLLPAVSRLFLEGDPHEFEEPRTEDRSFCTVEFMKSI